MNTLAEERGQAVDLVCGKCLPEQLLKMCCLAGSIYVCTNSPMLDKYLHVEANPICLCLFVCVYES
jgi:hypothetical protein